MSGLVVSEVFGPTVQGEGPTAGRRCGFVRLGRCNLDCGKGAGATWACDTPYTWDWDRYDQAKELARLPIGEVVAQVLGMGVDRVVVTGGEPMLQRIGLTMLAQELAEADLAVEVETNGTQDPWPGLVEAVASFNVSPKLACSGVPADRALCGSAIVDLHRSGKAWWKFVVVSRADIDEALQVADHFGLPLSRCWIMPAGTRPGDITRKGELVDHAVRRGFNVSSRLHVLTWGDERCR